MSDRDDYEAHRKNLRQPAKPDATPKDAFDGPKTATGELILDEDKIWKRYNEKR